MIRKMEQGDYSAVSKLLYNMYTDMNDTLDIISVIGDYNTFHQKFLSLPTIPLHHHYVYLVNNKVIAYYLLVEMNFPSKVIFDSEMMCYLALIVVESNSQNKGIGSILINHAKEQSLNLGYSELNLETMSNSTKNLKFYSKHEFIEYTRHLICDLEEEE